MRIFVHDYSGHPFQAQLSRELAARGHQVTHSYCAAYKSGKGDLSTAPNMSIAVVGERLRIDKDSIVRRLFQELRVGFDLARTALRSKPDVVMVANTPIPTLCLLVFVLWLRRVPWVLWHQDVQAIAIRSFYKDDDSLKRKLASTLSEPGEKWCARRASGIVVIADGFLRVHEEWGTAGKTVVIPNWAPLDEIEPRPRDNDWAREHGLIGAHTLVYSGTLGLKHNPKLLVQIARQLSDDGCPVKLVIVNEGLAEPVLRAEAERLDVDLTLEPFQPYERLPEVLGSGDILLVLLEPEAGVFSVPSKTLSYLCAGRPILGLLPAENQAASLIDQAGGTVLPPRETSVPEAAAWAAKILNDPGHATDIGRRSRDLAESRFGLKPCADQFEALLSSVAR